METCRETTSAPLTTQNLIDYISETREKMEDVQLFETALKFIYKYRDMIDRALGCSNLSKKDARFFVTRGIQWILNNNPRDLIANLPAKFT